MILSEAEELITAFENKTLPKKKWTHFAHFVMALWYTYFKPIPIARLLIKEGIKSYNLSVGGENTHDSGYHETITELYIRIIILYQLSFTREPTYEELLNRLDSQKFIDKNFVYNFYSKEVLISKEAREQWVEPDIRPIVL